MSEVKKINISLRANTQLTENLSFDGKINYVRTDGNQRPAIGSSGENVSNGFAILDRLSFVSGEIVTRSPLTISSIGCCFRLIICHKFW